MKMIANFILSALMTLAGFSLFLGGFGWLSATWKQWQAVKNQQAVNDELVKSVIEQFEDGGKEKHYRQEPAYRF